MCIMCGLDNPYGVRAPFYNMEDGSVMSIFNYREQHQSYPGRVHGGLITAMLDELGFRALWADELNESSFGVTTSLEIKYRKPVPYETELIGYGKIIKKTSNFFTAEAKIYDKYGAVLSNSLVKYIKLPVDRIADGVVEHEEMCYLIADGVTKIEI